MPVTIFRAGAGHAARRLGIALLLLATLIAQSPGLQPALARDAASDLPPAYPEPADLPELRPAKCLYTRDEIPDSMKDVDLTCGYVTVPQDHNDPEDEETIELYVVIIPATGKHPSDTPLFVLGGGPGQGITDFLWSFDADYGDDTIASLSPLLEDHDVVLFDQRGTGKTLPAVVCPADREPTGEEPAEDDEAAAYDNPYLDCAAQLADEGIDLNTYNNRQSVADIDAVRQALGASRIDLLGTSYGSMLALETMRYEPGIVRSAILNSPDIPEKQFFDSLMIGHQEALDATFAACADDPECDAAHPDLAATYTEVVQALNKKPMLLTFENPLTGKTEKAMADGGTFVNLVYQLIFFNVTIAYVPPLITSVAAGESDVFSALVPELISTSEGMSVPLHYSVLCQDELPYVDTDEVMDEVEDAGVSEEVIDAETSSMDGYFEICDAWDLDPSGEIANEPVVSDVPTFILTGRFDPITPTFDGERLLDNLSNAVLVEIPTAAHDPLDTSGRCGVAMAVAFLDAPRKELDTSCVDDLTLDLSPASGETTADSD
ncbi:MAG: alpha/beta hydrolase [Thermomicrobiales bacterium]